VAPASSFSEDDVEAARLMAKRPYVAIWIEDADRRPVRTIALLFKKSRHLSELRA
jgi:hypothetical protein